MQKVYQSLPKGYRSKGSLEELAKGYIKRMKEELDVTVTLNDVIIKQNAQSNTKKTKMSRRMSRRKALPWKFKSLQVCLYEPFQEKHEICPYQSRKMKDFAEMIDRCVCAGLG